MSLTFKSINLHNWRQFQAVTIDVHPQLTIITGSNGAGKTTILNLFSQHFGFARPFLSTPKRKRGGGIAYDLGYYARSYTYLDDEEEGDDEDGEELSYSDPTAQLKKWHRESNSYYERLSPPLDGQFVDIGSVGYSDGGMSPLGYYEQQVNSYGITIPSQHNVLGVAVGSHRTIANYQPVQGLSLSTLVISQAYQSYMQEYWSRMNGGHTGYSTIYRMKESLIAMAAFGEGNSHLEANADLLKAFNGFMLILRKVLPIEIGFQKLIVRLPDIVMKTKSGEFIMDSGSGGINAIIEIAWQIYLFSLTNEKFVATLDEPENHLHPSMQRSILANLIQAFPQVQFIVATHSPFIVSAVEDSHVYALRYVGPTIDENGESRRGQRRVESVKLDQIAKAGTASEILREVLGVSVSIPDWAQGRLDAIVSKYQDANLDVSVLNTLRTDLKAAGFSEFYPEALAKLVEGK